MSRVIARELFGTLIKLGDNPWNGYSILIDNNFVKRIHATSDQDAIKEFRNWVDERNKIKVSDDIYRVDVWQHHKIIDSFTTNLVDKINEWVIANGYKKLWDNGDCHIEVYKNEITLSLTEQENEGITFW